LLGGGLNAVKCPECGFVSFPGLDRCKKCGHLLTQARGESKGIPFLFQQAVKGTKAPAVPGAEPSQDHTEMAGHETGELDIELKPEGTTSDSAATDGEQQVPPPLNSQAAQDWQTELAERVQEYRQRRARLHKTEETDHETLDLDFEAPPPGQQETHPNVIEFPSPEELERQGKPALGARSATRKTGLENLESTLEHRGRATEPASSRKTPSDYDRTPLEIEMGSPMGNSAAGIRAGVPSGIPSASMSARFFAGLLDGLVLLAGGALYALIFWRVGGGISLQPLELGVVALIGVFFVLLYFAGCTALASATPGLIWTRLQVCTFEGDSPGLSDCLWRGFGYLVSMSALMLGFIWASVDADGLTWHDRMSRTFVVPAIHQ
jgi:uncharacterized RDD family membrane protein YckC